MIPKIILHNSISINGSLSSFEPNMELHYRIAGKYHPDMHLIGSHTITAGIELYGNDIPCEEALDFEKPTRRKTLPIWVLVDSKGKLEGMLHTCRRFELCRDVIVLVSKSTPQRYLRYLNERQYTHHCVGRDSVDLRNTLILLYKEYHAKTILTDPAQRERHDRGDHEAGSHLRHSIVLLGVADPARMPRERRSGYRRAFRVPSVRGITQ